MNIFKEAFLQKNYSGVNATVSVAGAALLESYLGQEHTWWQAALGTLMLMAGIHFIFGLVITLIFRNKKKSTVL
jgi:hypothetical protein